jgi:hypothetical protein
MSDSTLSSRESGAVLGGDYSDAVVASLLERVGRQIDPRACIIGAGWTGRHGGGRASVRTGLRVGEG